jgi:hypothetical protein
VPPGVEKIVVPGRKPDVQFWPPSREVDQPMFAAPPPVKRPVWKAVTIVRPADRLSGSTCV